jgi:peroxiredoxin
MRRAIPALILISAVLMTSCAPDKAQPTPEETTLTAVGDMAPDFEVVTLDGKPFNLSDQRGKVVLVNFFATWCPPCREELPHLEKEIWQRFSGESFSLVVLAREEDESVLRPFLEETGFTFPVAPDPDRAAFSKYASQYIPRNVVVDPGGTIIFQSQGFEQAEFNEMIAVIEKALAAMEPPTESDAEEDPAAA